VTLKDIETPVGLDAAEADRVLKAAGADTALCERMERISEFLLGRPYVEGSLGGGPGLREEYRVSLTAFDCVTFIEAVLALALSRTLEEVIETIRRIRYKDGEIDWTRRNHYMVDWVRNNEECGFVNDMTAGPFTEEKTCTLDLIAGLPAKVASFRYFPIQNRAEASALFETGDLILFVSTRETLDVFHTGLLVERERRWLMRHATRRAGAVIDQELVEFMSQNEMAGFILVRPLCRR